MRRQGSAGISRNLDAAGRSGPAPTYRVLPTRASPAAAGRPSASGRPHHRKPRSSCAAAVNVSSRRRRSGLFWAGCCPEWQQPCGQFTEENLPGWRPSPYSSPHFQARTAKPPRRGMHSPPMPASKPPCVATARSWPTAPGGDGRTQCDSMGCSTRPGRLPPVGSGLPARRQPASLPSCHRPGRTGPGPLAARPGREGYPGRCWLMVDQAPLHHLSPNH